MRKQKFVILLLTVLLLLAGCGGSGETPSESAPEQHTSQPAPITTAPDITPEPDVTLESEKEPLSGARPVDSVMGAHFLVPEGFVWTPMRVAAGHVYLYENEDLQMSIRVGEAAAVVIPAGDTAREIVEHDYAGYAESSRTPVYLHQGDGRFVVSDYYDYPEEGQTIYYYTEIASQDDSILYSVHFEYPTENTEQCNPIVEAFMDSFVFDR